MLKKVFLMSIVMLVVNLAVAPFALASDNPEKEAKFAEKVKTEITKLGTGTDAKVRIKLKDGTKLDGYVSEINDGSFTVIDKKSGNTVPGSYPSVKQVKGNNLSSGVIVAIGFAAFFVVIILILHIQRQNT